MLHLRRSTLLKQLFHTNLQRPVAASRNKSLKSHNCAAAASFDANAVSTLKVLGRHAYTARAPRPFLSSGASWSARSYCVKSKDVNAAAAAASQAAAAASQAAAAAAQEVASLAAAAASVPSWDAAAWDAAAWDAAAWDADVLSK